MWQPRKRDGHTRPSVDKLRLDKRTHHGRLRLLKSRDENSAREFIFRKASVIVKHIKIISSQSFLLFLLPIELCEKVGFCFEGSSLIHVFYFFQSTEYLASKKICNNCTNKLIQSYKFIQNSKFTARLLSSYVNDLESKTKDLFTHLKDTEMESNIFIILENEHEGNKSYVEENYKYLTKIKEEQETNLKKNINSQYILPRYKVHSKTKCRLCHIILEESEIKNHLREVHEESVFLCKICSEVFYTSSSLEMHAKITHAVLTERLQCVMCLKDIEDNQEHICEFKCPECNEPSCIHFIYLISYREKVLKESKPKCLDCDYVCRNKEALISHVNRHHLNHSPYTCDKCAEKFHSRIILRAHMNSHKHTFTCEFCNLNLFNESSLAAHTYVCKDVKRENTCKECPANFDSTEELLEHGKLKHTEGMSLCNGKFFSKPKREHHTARVRSEVYKKTANSVICEENYETKEIKQIKLHAASKFLCKICNVEYDSLRKLCAHNRKHVGPFSKCHFCKKQIRKALFQKHTESHGVVSCNKCDKSFENITLLKYHQKSHLDDVQCPKCNLKMNPGKLTRHVKSHVIDDNPQLKEDKKQKPNIECELCDYITWNSILLECHMNRYHLKIKPYVCHICSKNFIGKHLLKKHLKHHTANQSVICTICGKKLANSSCLKSHLKLHTGEKNYPCDVCGQRFRSSSIMNVHKVKKHSERDAACPLCSSKFHTLVELRRHVVKTHWKKDTKFDPRELKGLENHYHLFHDGRRIRMDDHDVDFYLPC